MVGVFSSFFSEGSTAALKGRREGGSERGAKREREGERVWDDGT